MKDDPLNIVVCGIGGQGNILISRLIGRIMTSKEYFVTIGETFGAAQRGGAVHSSLRISGRRFYGPLIPEGRGHVVLGLEPLESLRVLGSYGNPRIITITNNHPRYPVGVLSMRTVYPQSAELELAVRGLSGSAWFLDSTRMAVELGVPIAANIVMLGALVGSGAVPILQEVDVERELANSFGKSKLALNLEAFRRGVAKARERT